MVWKSFTWLEEALLHVPVQGGTLEVWGYGKEAYDDPWKNKQQTTSFIHFTWVGETEATPQTNIWNAFEAAYVSMYQCGDIAI